MTTDQRVQAIAEFGFTERQARFLELVMRHAGVCVPRQYASFAGIANGGRKSNAFFAKLVRRGYARASQCVHNKARVFHIHHKPLYYAIGEPESRHRRPVSARGAVDRLMLLDAVLATPALTWLTTAPEKLACMASLTNSQAAEPTSPRGHETPANAPAESLETFSANVPVGIDASGRIVVLYLATVPWTDDFRASLQGHAALLRHAPAWTIRLAFPTPVDRAYDAYRAVVRDEFESPLQRSTISELKWYFTNRRKAATEGVHPQTQRFLDRGAEVFSTPRFTMLYRCWQKFGDSVFGGLSSTVLGEALATGTGRVECVVLPHSYRHLVPLVHRIHSDDEAFRNGKREGKRPSYALNPFLNPLTWLHSWQRWRMGRVQVRLLVLHRRGNGSATPTAMEEAEFGGPALRSVAPVSIFCGSTSTPTRRCARWGPRAWAHQDYPPQAPALRGLDPPGALALGRQLPGRRRTVRNRSFTQDGRQLESFRFRGSPGITGAVYRRRELRLRRRHGAAGHDVRAIVEINTRRMTRSVLSLARSETRVLLTEDKDFGLLALRLGPAATLRA